MAVNADAILPQAPEFKGKKKKKKIDGMGVLKLTLQAMLGAIVVVVGTKLFELVENKTKRYTLRPCPENFHIAEEAYEIFGKLATWKRFSPEDYDNCLRSTDVLLLIEKQFNNKRPTGIDDVKRAEQAFKMSLSYLNSLKEHVIRCESVKPKSIVRLDYIIQAAVEFLSFHMQSVFILAALV
jgi:hypothetical protein